MTPEGPRHHRRTAPSLLAAPRVTLEGKRLTWSWIIHFGTRVVIQEVFCEVFDFLPLGDSVLEGETWKYLQCANRNNLYMYSIIYPGDPWHVFVDWRQPPDSRGRDPHPPVLWLGAFGVIIIFEWFTPETFWVKFLLYIVKNSIRLNQIRILWVLFKTAKLCCSSIVRKGPKATSGKFMKSVYFLKVTFFLTK